MEQSQLVELIRTLSPKEKEHILHFAAVPFFLQGKGKSYILPFLEICLKHPWHDPAQKLEKVTVYTKLFKGQAFVDKKLEKVMVEAHKVIRSFLLTQYYFREENEFHQVFDFAEIIRLRGLEQRYSHLLTQLKKIMEAKQGHSTLHFHDQFLLEYIIHNQESLHNQVRGDLNIPNTLDALEMHLHLNRLALLNVYLLQQKVANITVPNSMKERLEDPLVPERFIERSATLEINYAIFKLLAKGHNEPHDIQLLFDLLLHHENNLTADQLRDFYTYLRNICALVLMSDSEAYEVNDLLYELYKNALERGYLHYEGKLHPSHYLAISECAARSKKYEWALSFIEKHKNDIIGENESRDTYRLNLAHYLFGVGKFSECLDNIPSSSQDVSNLLASKRLELKALYELQSELFPYKLDAFKMFLNRTSKKLLPAARRQMNLEFNNLLYQLAAIPPNDPKRAARFLERVKERKQTAERYWLLVKAKQLAKKPD
jgi:hypothetical protein